MFLFQTHFLGRYRITSKALELALVYAFEQFDINRIFSRVFEHNKASMAVLLNNGFEQEGVLKQAVIKNNVICDEYCLGLLSDYLISNN